MGFIVFDEKRVYGYLVKGILCVVVFKLSMEIYIIISFIVDVLGVKFEKKIL